MEETEYFKDCTIYDELEQGTKEWFDARAGIPTASEAYKILGSKGVYATYLVGKEAEKFMDVFDPGYQGGVIARAHELEPIAVDKFAEQYFKDCYSVGFVRNNKLNAGWSPDSLIRDESAAVEVKCFEKVNHYKVFKEGPGQKETDQCRFGLTVSGLEKMYLVYFNPDFKPSHQMKVFEIGLDDKMRIVFKTLIKAVNIATEPKDEDPVL